MKPLVIVAIAFAAALPTIASAAPQTEKSCVDSCRRAGGDVSACVSSNN